MPPRGGNQIARSSTFPAWLFQLMPPRGGNRLSNRIFKEIIFSFNSCPREGAIIQNNLRTKRWNVFQLMPPRGGNLKLQVLKCILRDVSTHAPARGQSRGTFRASGGYGFQLMPPRGGNRVALSLQLIRPTFQLMPPRGGNRVALSSGQGICGCFNSCPREGAIGKPFGLF